ncbi:hypothetical protein ABZY02_35010 [Streptomyces sp. NPDC006649]|uniref:hypothetical protein n=1 Tax=Streptomyces sp. NPDC006649 TaxID=3156896 RepID=UPI0033B195AB
MSRHIHPGSLGRTAWFGGNTGIHTHGVFHRTDSQAGENLAARHAPWCHHQRAHGDTLARGQPGTAQGIVRDFQAGHLTLHDLDAACREALPLLLARLGAGVKEQRDTR